VKSLFLKRTFMTTTSIAGKKPATRWTANSSDGSRRLGALVRYALCDATFEGPTRPSWWRSPAA